jgi:hypothetical protein
MAKQRVEIDDSIVPAGYVVTGEYRRPFPDEPVLTTTGEARTIHANDQCGLSVYRIILRKVEPVRESRWGFAYAPFKTREEYIAAYPDAEIPVRVEFENARPVSATVEGVE